VCVLRKIIVWYIKYQDENLRQTTELHGSTSMIRIQSLIVILFLQGIVSWRKGLLLLLSLLLV